MGETFGGLVNMVAKVSWSFFSDYFYFLNFFQIPSEITQLPEIVC